MNIFVLDDQPENAARYHCDKHVVKMVLETAQILCAVWYRHGWTFPGIYRLTHPHHPCTLWAGNSVDNYRWTVELFRALLDQYTHRYKKIHKCEAMYEIFDELPEDAEEKMDFGDQGFVFCGPDECVRETVVESYRALYRLKDKTLARPMVWTRVPKPTWMEERT